jgi:cyclic dehypoxanthinyl futalosine synthase
MGISREQALDCLRSDDLIGVGMEADAVRRQLHPEGVVSYAIGARICCGGLGAATEEAVERTVEHICAEIRTTAEMGGSTVRLVGWSVGRKKTLGVSEIEWLLKSLHPAVRMRFPAIWLESLSAAEIWNVARQSGVTVGEVLARLRDVGLDSIAGDGLAVGNDSAGAQPGLGLMEWLEVHRAAHQAGMLTTAVVTLGAGEGAAQGALVDLLQAVRRLQEETGGFAAFAPRSFQPQGGGSGYGPEEPTAVACLKTLAISRMMLDNIENIESSAAGRGLKVLQTGVRFGANDAGWWMTEGNEAKGTGAAVSPGEEDLRRVIRDAGFRPVERDAVYRTMFLS